MKYVIGCLALIGLGIILAIGGCLGLVGYGIASIPKIPDYVTRIAVEKRYERDLGIIDAGIRDGTLGGLASKVSADILAVYTKSADVLKKVTITSESYSSVNGIGVGTLRTNTGELHCIVYQMKKGGESYEVFIADHGPPAGHARSPAQ